MKRKWNQCSTILIAWLCSKPSELGTLSLILLKIYIFMPTCKVSSSWRCCSSEWVWYLNPLWRLLSCEGSASLLLFHYASKPCFSLKHWFFSVDVSHKALHPPYNSFNSQTSSLSRQVCGFLPRKGWRSGALRSVRLKRERNAHKNTSLSFEYQNGI